MPSLDNNDVWVIGEVRRLDLTGAEREIGEDTPDAHVGTTAIIADSLALEPPRSAGKDGASGEKS